VSSATAPLAKSEDDFCGRRRPTHQSAARSNLNFHPVFKLDLLPALKLDLLLVLKQDFLEVFKLDFQSVLKLDLLLVLKPGIQSVAAGFEV